jgi:hypothetical protein
MLSQQKNVESRKKKSLAACPKPHARLTPALELDDSFEATDGLRVLPESLKHKHDSC